MISEAPTPRFSASTRGLQGALLARLPCVLQTAHGCASASPSAAASSSLYTFGRLRNSQEKLRGEIGMNAAAPPPLCRWLPLLLLLPLPGPGAANGGGDAYSCRCDWTLNRSPAEALSFPVELESWEPCGDRVRFSSVPKRTLWLCGFWKDPWVIEAVKYLQKGTANGGGDAYSCKCDRTLNSLPAEPLGFLAQVQFWESCGDRVRFNSLPWRPLWLCGFWNDSWVMEAVKDLQMGVPGSWQVVWVSVLCGLLIVAALALVVCWWWRRQRRHQLKQGQPEFAVLIPESLPCSSSGAGL